MPPLDGQLLLADGFHRCHAHNVLRNLTICTPSWSLGHPRDLSRLGIDAGRLRVLLCYVLGECCCAMFWEFDYPPRPGA